MDDNEYLVWSNEHRAWWCPKAQGYTTQLKNAGRYSRDEAISHSRSRDHVNGILPELPVRLLDVLETER